MLEVDIRCIQGDFTLAAELVLQQPVTGIFGASGAGKSTLLTALAGLRSVLQGRIVLDGRTLFDTAAGIDVPPHRRRIGFVFQDGQLFAHMDVRSNLRYGMRHVHGRAHRFNFQQVVELLEIGGLMDRRPRSLSGGERQRVALGRALLSSPELLLLDEPLASLDERLKQQILPFLRRIEDELGMAMVYVSHSINEILYLTQHLAVMERGRVIAHGAFIDTIKDQHVLALAHSLGLENVVPVTIIEHRPAQGCTLAACGQQRMALPLTAIPPGRAAYVSVRAEHVALAMHEVSGTSIQNQLAGVIKRLTQIENRAVCEIDIGVIIIAEVTLIAAQELRLHEGQTVYCLIKSNAMRLLGQGSSKA